MNPYAKVRAPNFKDQKEKPDAKQSEISINFKQPFKLTKAPIEQPRIKVNNAPSVVHIIERKVNKKEPIKSNANLDRIHVIEPSSNAKKGWKFNNINDEDSQQIHPELEDHISKRQSSNIIQKPKEQLSVSLQGIEETYNNQNKRVTYQRMLEKASISSVHHSSQEIYEQSSAHYLDDREGFELNPIEIQTIVEHYRSTDKEALKRKLIYNQFGDKMKDEAVIKPQSLENNMIQIYQFEQKTPKFDRIKLKRKLLPINKSDQIILSQLSESLSSQRRSFLIVQDHEGQLGCQQIVISDDIQQKQAENLIKNHQRRFWMSAKNKQNDQIIKANDQILVPYDYQSTKLKQNPQNHKRLMTHNRVLNEQNELQILPNQSSFSQIIKIQQIQEKLNEKSKSSKQSRKLLFIQKQGGEILAQYIVIPEQYEQKKHQRIINYQRAINHNQIYKDQKELKDNGVLKPHIPEESLIDIQAVSERRLDPRRSMLIRQLLLIQSDERQLLQQIRVPEVQEQRSIEKSVINHRRLMQHNQIIKEKQESMEIGSIPYQNHLEENIIIQSMEEQRESSKRKSKLTRKLLLLQSKDGRVLAQQVVIPQQFQQESEIVISQLIEKKQDQRQLLTQKRGFKIIQIQDQLPIQDQKPKNVFQQKDIIIQPINEEYHIKKSQKSSKRNLLVINNPSGSQIYQEITIPQSFQIKNGRVSQINYTRRMQHNKQQNQQKKMSEYEQVLAPSQQIDIPFQQESKSKGRLVKSHKRMMKHLQSEPINDDIANKDVLSSIVDEYPISKSLEIDPLFENSASRKKKSNQIRNLLIIKDQHGNISSQDIIIPQQFQHELNENQLFNHKRHVKIVQFEDKSQHKKAHQNHFMSQQPLIDSIEINSIEEKCAPQQRTHKIMRNLLIIKNDSDKLFCQEIFVPSEQQEKRGSIGLTNHKRQFKIVKIDEQSNNRMEQNQQESLQEQKMNGKVGSGSHNASFEDIHEEEPIIISQLHQDHKDGQNKPRLKRALLLIKDEKGKDIFQEIIIPNDEFQINQQPKLYVQYKRNIKSKVQQVQNNEKEIEKDSNRINDKQSININKQVCEPLIEYIEIPEQIQSKNLAQSSNKIKRLIKTSTQVQEAQKNQKVKGAGVLEPFQVSINDPKDTLKVNHEKSFNPSTLNSSTAQNINLISSSVEQYNPHADKRQLVRALAPSPQQKMINSDHFVKFNVFHPKSYLSNSFSAGQHHTIMTNEHKIKPYRRPGMKSPHQ